MADTLLLHVTHHLTGMLSLASWLVKVKHASKVTLCTFVTVMEASRVAMLVCVASGNPCRQAARVAR